MVAVPTLTIATLLILFNLPNLCSAIVYKPPPQNDSSSTQFQYAVSINMPLNYSEETMYSPDKAKRRQRTPGAGGETPPGDDTGPDGVYIYSSVDQVPTARLLGRSTQMQTCYGSRDGNSRCWEAYVCGHRCEPVLLAVNSFCRRKEASKDDRWIRCQKARKFNRCYARLCFRTRSMASRSRETPTPVSYEDPLSVSIVRYKRPMRKSTPFL